MTLICDAHRKARESAEWTPCVLEFTRRAVRLVVMEKAQPLSEANLLEQTDSFVGAD